MTKTALLSVLMQLERELHLTARSDARRLAELLHPDLVEFGCSGHRYGFSELIAYLQREPAAVAIHSQDFAVRLVAEGVALLTYQSAQVGRDGALERHALRSSLWQHTAQGWPCCSIRARSPRLSRSRRREGTPCAAYASRQQQALSLERQPVRVSLAPRRALSRLDFRLPS